MKNMIINAKEVVTPIGNSARKAKDMKAIEIIENASIIIKDGIIIKVGPTEEVLMDFDKSGYEIIDATDRSVLPGFVDSHTHFVFGGYREKEFNWRLEGVAYMDIMERGGGIINSVNSTRDASKEELMTLGMERLDSMLEFGVTTVEGKSGYGLETVTELKQLEVMKELDKVHPIDIVRTYMGAHATPAEYKGREDEFIDLLIKEGLPQAIKNDLSEFCDIFCEKNVFTVEQSRKLLSAAREMGYKLKIHADEIVQLGGAELAAELRTFSADHLLQASDEGFAAMAENDVVATLLPCTAFSLKEHYARARHIIDNGGAVAVATDFNPGSCFTNSIPLLIALSTIYMGMTIEEVITAITLNGAAAIDRAKEVGSIEAGKKGDIVILKTPSYKFLPYHFGINLVDKVIKDGELVYSKK